MVRFTVAAADLWAKLDTIPCVFLLVMLPGRREAEMIQAI